MTGPPTDPPPTIRLLIADDQALIRRGLAMMLGAEPGIEVVGQAADGVEAIEQALERHPDVVIMDLQMPRASGVVATREITARLPQARVVVLTTFDHDDLVFEAIRAGAHAYLLKDASEADVLETVRAVHRGESRLSPPIARKVIEQFRAFHRSPAIHDSGVGDSGVDDAVNGAGDGAGDGALDSAGTASAPATMHRAAADPLHEPLTDKEERVLDLIAQGLSNKQIASTVFLAEGTVKNYVSRIMDKLHARNRTELAVRAVERRG